MTLTATSTRTPDEALHLLLAGIDPVGSEVVALSEASGRVLAQQVVTDRASPATDVSAMDGFALRIADVSRASLRVSHTLSAGEPAHPLPLHSCARIATGAPIPAGAELVIPREHVDECVDECVDEHVDECADERDEHISVHAARAATARIGAQIRRQGENAVAGAVVLERGCVIHAAAASALAAFGVSAPLVARRVRIALLVTGDEVQCAADGAGEALAPWQVRDSNGPSVRALFAAKPWIDPIDVEHVADDARSVCAALERAVQTHDMVLMTGGVAVGHRDFVATSLDSLGAQTLFHGIAQRPGRPLLGATLRGQRVLCLPGNPVSVMVTARRYALPLARAYAGCTAVESMRPLVTVLDGPTDTSNLTRFVPVQWIAQDQVRALPTRGSGDCASVAASDGFVEIPALSCGASRVRFFDWM